MTPKRNESFPLVVSYGGGTNSTAMLCGFRERDIRPDLIVFADTGAEMPHTYEHVSLVRETVRAWWGVALKVVKPSRTIVEHCESTSMLPSLAYGRRSCSQKFKHEPLERLLKDWMRGGRVPAVTKAIGYHAEEGYRAAGKPTSKELIKGCTEHYWYPLIEWQWRQEDCLQAICRHKLPRPLKSACFFCPASKRSEVLALRQNHPELYAKAAEIETNAQKRHRQKIGLGGIGNLWSEWVAMDDAQAKLHLDIEPHEMPCGCLD